MSKKNNIEPYVQLDLFKSDDKFDQLVDFTVELKKSQDNIRKGMFSRHAELASLVMEMIQRIDKVEETLGKDYIKEKIMSA